MESSSSFEDASASSSTGDAQVLWIGFVAAGISVLGRNTQGVRLMRVDEGSKVVCVARTEADEEEPEEAETPAESEIPNLESDEEI